MCFSCLGGGLCGRYSANHQGSQDRKNYQYDQKFDERKSNHPARSAQGKWTSRHGIIVGVRKDWSMFDHDYYGYVIAKNNCAKEFRGYA
jgi:hypothetical protein